MRRVVITGMGAITPVGLSVEEFWNSVKEGKTNFAEVTRFDSTNYRAHMAAEINNFNPKDYMDFKSAKRMELFSQYAVAAAKEAIEQSGPILCRCVLVLMGMRWYWDLLPRYRMTVSRGISSGCLARRMFPTEN